MNAELDEAARDEPRLLERPSAFGDRRRSSRLIWVLARTELRQRYANAILGYLWALLDPLLMWVVLYFVLDRVIVYGAQIEHYSAFLLMNIILYFFFREATTRGYRPIRAKGANLMRKMEFPRVVLPLAAIVSTGLSYIGALPLLFIFLIISGVEPMWTWLLFPVILLTMFTFAVGTALFLAAIYARVADLEYVWRALVRVQFWSTPVLFAVATIPAVRLRDVILINPLSVILAQANIWIIDPNAPGVADVAGSSTPVWIALGIFLTVCLLGPVAFARAAHRVAERV